MLVTNIADSALKQCKKSAAFKGLGPSIQSPIIRSTLFLTGCCEDPFKVEQKSSKTKWKNFSVTCRAVTENISKTNLLMTGIADLQVTYATLDFLTKNF